MLLILSSKFPALDQSAPIGPTSGERLADGLAKLAMTMRELARPLPTLEAHFAGGHLQAREAKRLDGGLAAKTSF